MTPHWQSSQLWCPLCTRSGRSQDGAARVWPLWTSPAPSVAALMLGVTPGVKLLSHGLAPSVESPLSHPATQRCTPSSPYSAAPCQQLACLTWAVPLMYPLSAVCGAGQHGFGTGHRACSRTTDKASYTQHQSTRVISSQVQTQHHIRLQKSSYSRSEYSGSWVQRRITLQQKQQIQQQQSMCQLLSKVVTCSLIW